MQWYLTRYAKLSNGRYELISYTPMPTFEDAYHKAQTKLPNNEFYEAEHRVGSLLPALKFCWIARTEYSHKPHIAEAQAQAEVKAQAILNVIAQSTLDLDVKSIMDDILLLKPLLTKPQYNILLTALMSTPQIIRRLNNETL